MIVDAIRAKQVVLLAGLLLIEGKVPPASVAFLAKSYLDLSDPDTFRRGITIKRMADNYECTHQAARKHVMILDSHDLLNRVQYQRWQFNWACLKRLNNLDNINF